MKQNKHNENTELTNDTEHSRESHNSQDKTINLAREKVADPNVINKMLDAGIVSDAINMMRECLGAKKKFWSKVTKEWIEEPDYRIRLDAAKLILSYAIGEPVKRSINIGGSEDGFRSLRDIIIESAAHSIEARRLVESSKCLELDDLQEKPPTL